MAEQERCIHDLNKTACVLCSRPAWGVYEPAVSLYGPWQTGAAAGMATEDVWSCAGDGCDYEITPSDMIRSDGEGGWHCWVCGNEKKEGI